MKKWLLLKKIKKLEFKIKVGLFFSLTIFLIWAIGISIFTLVPSSESLRTIVLLSFLPSLIPVGFILSCPKSFPEGVIESQIALYYNIKCYAGIIISLILSLIIFFFIGWIIGYFIQKVRGKK